MRWRRFLPWLAFGLAALLALWVGLATLWLPGRLSREIRALARERLGLGVEIGRVRCHPLLLRVTVDRLSLLAPDGTRVAGWERLSARWIPWTLAQGRWRVGRVEWDRPYLLLDVAASGEVNWVGFLAHGRTAAAPPGGQPVAWQVDGLDLRGGTLELRDATHSPSFQHRFDSLHLALDDVRSAEGEPGRLRLSVRDSAGMTLQVTGSVHPARPQLSLRVAVAGLSPSHWQAYTERALGWRFPEGSIEADLTVRLVDRAGPPLLEVRQGRLTATGLTVQPAGSPAAPWLSVGQLDLQGFNWDSESNFLRGQSIAMEGGRLTLLRAADRSVNWSPATATPDRSAPAAPGVSSEPPGLANRLDRPPFRAMIEEFRLAGGSLQMVDRAVHPAADLDLAEIDLRAGPLTWPSTDPIRLETTLRVEEAAPSRLAGTWHPAAGQAAGRLDLVGFPLPALNALLARQVRAWLAGGVLEAHGDFAVSTPPGAAPAWRWRGEVGCRGFDARESNTGEALLGWGQLLLPDLQVDTASRTASAGEIDCRGPQLHLLIAADARPVWKTLAVAPSPTAAPTNSGEAAPPPVPGPASADPPAAPATWRMSLAGAKVQDGRVRYTDHSMAPAVTLELSALEVNLGPVDSANTDRADFRLSGQWPGGGTLRAGGRINPLTEAGESRLEWEIAGFELAALSPYSGRFIGYPIRRGRLDWTARNRYGAEFLEADNAVRLHRLELGEATGSPDAVQAPVKLAVALLENREGRIDLNLPVRGNPSDPNFRYARVVWKAVGKLLAKTPTAPFKLLGSILGSSADLSQLSFPAGSEIPDAAGREELQQLGRVLTDRPRLEVEITGCVDPSADPAALRDAALRRQLVAFRDQSERIRGSRTEDLTPEEVERWLPGLHAQRFPPPPAPDPEQPPEPLPLERMREELLAAQTIGPSDLQILAQRRAEAAKEGLAREAGVDPARVFLRQAGPAEFGSGAQVLFAVRAR